MGIKNILQDKMKEVEEFPEEYMDKLPSGYQHLDKRIILNLHQDLHPYAKQIAQALMDFLPRMKGIWLRKGQIKGKYRKPTGLEHILGDDSSEAIVKENGIRYKFDFTKIMFAKGNVHERKILPNRIDPGNVIVDMFAGIGYFSLGIAKKADPKKVYSIEWNEVAFKYLKKNCILNHVEEVIEPILGNCKEQVPKLAKNGVKADYVIMGLLPAPLDAISPALSVAKKEGTIVVYEGVEGEDSTRLFDQFSEIAKEEGFQTEQIDRRLVKSFAPHRYHVVLEIMVKKPE